MDFLRKQQLAEAELESIRTKRRLGLCVYRDVAKRGSCMDGSSGGERLSGVEVFDQVSALHAGRVCEAWQILGRVLGRESKEGCRENGGWRHGLKCLI